MKDVFFQEIRESNKVIKRITDMSKKEAGNKMLAETIKGIVGLANISRKEGLLALEEAAFRMEDNAGILLKYMVGLIVDGTDPKLVEEMGLFRYFASDITGYEALNHLLILRGSLAIQEGIHPFANEQLLLSMIPCDAAEIYSQKKKELEEAEEKRQTDPNRDFLEKFYSGEIAVVPGDAGYYIVKLTDYVIKVLDDHSLQRVLRDIENHNLISALIGLSGESRRRILNNLSRKLAEMIAEDMEFAGSVRESDFVDSTKRIFGTIILLLDNGEITCTDEEVLKVFSKIFDADDDSGVKRKRETAESEIYKMMLEYNSSAGGTIVGTWK